MTLIGTYAFSGCSKLGSVTIYATTPPNLQNNGLPSAGNLDIYVPAESVDAYKSATNWSNYAERIYAIE